MHELFVLLIAAAAASGCRPVVCFGGGTFEGTVSVRKDGLTVEHPGWASDVYAYDDNPFAGCSEIGAIVYGDGPTDGSIFTNLETVGTVAGDLGYFGDFSGNSVVDQVDGFDQVLELGQAGPGIRVMTGFNSVAKMGPLDLPVVKGFSALEECGTLSAGDVPGLVSLRVAEAIDVGGNDTELNLPSLEEVAGNAVLSSSSAVREVHFPKLSHVGGSFVLSRMIGVRVWDGMAAGGESMVTL